MREGWRWGLGLLAGAIALGVLGDAVLREGPFGIGLALGFAALAAVVWGVATACGIAVRRETAIGVLGALAFSLGFAWRAAPGLLALDLLAVTVLLSRPFWRAAQLHDAVTGAARTAFEALSGALPLLAAEVPWTHAKGAWRPVSGVAGGVLLAVPLLLLFGSLFSSADAGFAALMRRAFQVDGWWIVEHGLVVALLSWPIAGYLRGLLGPAPAPLPPSSPLLPRLGVIEVATVLVLLDAMFLLFVALQVRYLFGGAGHVWSTDDLTFADYARRGFFELVTVSALALPLLWGLHAMMDRREARHERLFRALALVLLATVGAILASAMHRMAVYQAEFGLTVLRVYVLAFEIWLVGLLAWFARTVLLGDPSRFFGGAVTWGLVGLAAMHGPNWEALIVKANVARPEKPEAVDVAYLGELSADAVPALVASMDALSPTMRPVMARYVLANWRDNHRGWASWNYGHAAAFAAVAAHRQALERIVAEAPDGPLTDPR